MCPRPIDETNPTLSGTVRKAPRQKATTVKHAKVCCQACVKEEVDRILKLRESAYKRILEEVVKASEKRIIEEYKKGMSDLKRVLMDSMQNHEQNEARLMEAMDSAFEANERAFEANERALDAKDELIELLRDAREEIAANSDQDVICVE